MANVDQTTMVITSAPLTSTGPTTPGTGMIRFFLFHVCMYLYWSHLSEDILNSKINFKLQDSVELALDIVLTGEWK